MSDFEFVFVLYGLLLGLAMAELLAGFGNALEAKLHRQPGESGPALGWLTPLMAIFVMLDLLSFWVFAWRVRDEISVSASALFGVTAFASAYYLAARLVFPRNPDHLPDLDEHFLRIRRPVFGILAALVALQWLFLAFEARTPGLIAPFPIAMTVLLVILMVGAALVRSRRAAALCLVLLILRYLWFYAIR